MELGHTIAFVGAGNMGEALIKGLLKAGTVKPEQLRVSEPRDERRAFLDETYGIKTVAANRQAVKEADVVILAVKPQILDKVLDEVGPDVAPTALVISVAAGRRIAAIEARLPPGRRVVRTMPNVASLVQAGATAVAGGVHATDADVAVARKIFDSVGLTIVIDETLMDAVTGLSGSGPAYVFMIIEALGDAGVKMGLSRWDAHALACQTVYGAAKLVIESKEHPGRLKDMVCSPGGTAIAAVHTLETGGLRTTLMNAVEAATQRSRELGEVVNRK
jgi:pyrroline-5-carboxylate reductase